MPKRAQAELRLDVMIKLERKKVEVVQAAMVRCERELELAKASVEGMLAIKAGIFVKTPGEAPPDDDTGDAGEPTTPPPDAGDGSVDETENPFKLTDTQE